MTTKDKIKEMEKEEKELREYIKNEWVDTGFIQVFQWKNFTDYLKILIDKKQREALEDVKELIENFDFDTIVRHLDGRVYQFKEEVLSRLELEK